MVKSFVEIGEIARDNNGKTFTVNEILSLFGYSKKTYINDIKLGRLGIIKYIGMILNEETGKMISAYKILVPLGYK